jgi:hypothetical protein
LGYASGGCGPFALLVVGGASAQCCGSENGTALYYVVLMVREECEIFLGPRFWQDLTAICNFGEIQLRDAAALFVLWQDLNSKKKGKILFVFNGVDIGVVWRFKTTFPTRSDHHLCFQRDPTTLYVLL